MWETTDLGVLYRSPVPVFSSHELTIEWPSPHSGCRNGSCVGKGGRHGRGRVGGMFVLDVEASISIERPRDDSPACPQSHDFLVLVFSFPLGTHSETSQAGMWDRGYDCVRWRVR